MLTNYKMKYPSISKFKKLGFRTEDDETFSYRFPVMRWGNIPTLWGVIYVDLDGRIWLDVFDNNGGVYPPFYKVEYGNYEAILAIINRCFENKFEKFGIKENVKKHGKKEKRSFNGRQQTNK